MKLDIHDLHLKEIVISDKSSIKDAIKSIQANSERVCFVVDRKKIMLSSISDGDIRRGLLKGYKLNDKVKRIQNKNFNFLQYGFSMEEAYRKFLGKINILPIIDEKGKFKGIVKKHDIVPFLDIKSKKILVVGLGYVGLTLSLVLAESGFEVTGYDKNQKLINIINKKKAPFYEKGLERYLEENLNNNFNVSNKPISSDVYIVTVGTPLDKAKSQPDLTILKKSILDICKLLKKNDLIILRSTVPVGCTRNFVAKLIEKETKFKFGKDIFLSFCPERTIEGKAIEELKKLPQIVGSYCKKSSELSKRIFSEYNYTVVEVSNLESAELSKLIDNSFRDTMFAYSNQLALLTEKLNLNLVEIVDKVNLGYKRNKIPKPSPGVGGPCLSKDSYILSNSFEKNNIGKNNIIYNARLANERMIKEIFTSLEKILKKLNKKKNSKIFITGFAFKGNPETSDTRMSTTISLLDIFKKNKFNNIWGHDFKLKKNEIEKLDIKSCSLEKGFLNADAVLIMNNNKKYEDLNIINLFKKTKKPLLFYDSWQLFDPLEIKNIKGITYASVGHR
jgi:UDP-N-acetyl-D-mannosaminuronic acid dehydrogenase